MSMANNIVLSEKVQKELINITKKGNPVDVIKELLKRELIRPSICL